MMPWGIELINGITGNVMSTHLTRRNFLKTAALVLIPLVAVTRQASANSNSIVRAELKYQNTPMDNMNCSTCLEFIPGKSDKDSGRCKVIAGDDKISPNGYCTKWNSM